MSGVKTPRVMQKLPGQMVTDTHELIDGSVMQRSLSWRV